MTLGQIVGLPCGLLIGRHRVPLGHTGKKEVLELARRQCMRVQMALLANTAKRDEGIGLRTGLDSVGSDGQTNFAHERNDGAHDRSIVRVGFPSKQANSAEESHSRGFGLFDMLGFYAEE